MGLIIGLLTIWVALYGYCFALCNWPIATVALTYIVLRGLTIFAHRDQQIYADFEYQMARRF